ncbi:MAG: hypothetical protein WCK63_07100 [Betaproteobacteria bacterium]
MEADLQACVAFYLTGKKRPNQLGDIAGLNLRPALFSGYRDLTRLRYDFPLVLINDSAEGRTAEPLSGLIDGILNRVAQGSEGERIRKHVLRLEQEIRLLASQKAESLFSELWDQAAIRLGKKDPLMAESLSRARANLNTDGEVIDCDATLSSHLLGHAWGLTQIRRAKRFNADIRRLILKLSDILQADFVNSDAGKSASTLKAAFGSGPLDNFNFDVMSHLLKSDTPRKTLSKTRRQRVTALISTLQAQKFFPTTATQAGAANSPYAFAFASCTAALKAYRERFPKAVELAKALAIAELEIRGDYSEEKHDALFESYGENGLGINELAQFPDYLVRLNISALSGPEQDTLNEILAAELPIKILVQTDDILEPSPIEQGHTAFALRSKQLAGMVMGLGGTFVVQAPASSLTQMRVQLQRGLDYAGPALFSIYSGATPSMAPLPPYLAAAAALESRAFPAFCFDPSAGDNWASRFSLTTNPQAAADWPLRELAYQDERYQAKSAATPFTEIDFVACDARYAKHFALVPRASWSEAMVPVTDIVPVKSSRNIETVPFVMMIDGEDKLHKVIVDAKLMREARRCKKQWNSLQELGGIHNSHAEKLLASEKQAWEQTVSAAAPKAEIQPSVAPAVAAAPVVVEAEPEKSPDEAYIETPRCSTCNECVQLNGKMFAYDGNQQAFIADVSAGTYAQLVEAAENCQVSIIHPGKPRNPNEPGLEELIKRAELFV